MSLNLTSAISFLLYILLDFINLLGCISVQSSDSVYVGSYVCYYLFNLWLFCGLYRYILTYSRRWVSELVI